MRAALALALVLAGCDGGEDPDAGGLDGGGDAGTNDAGPRDAGTDAFAGDAGPPGFRQRLGAAAYHRNASRSTWRALCDGQCAFISDDTTLSDFCAGNCSFISDFDMSYFCRGGEPNCGVITGDIDLPQFCFGCCECVMDPNLQALCLGRCDLIDSLHPLYYYCLGQCELL